jgi:UDP-N-acetylmuramate dehydrogenase
MNLRILSNHSLRPFNTFGLDVSARSFVEVRSPEEFLALRHERLYGESEKLVLGGGSNIVLRGDFDGLVIKNSIPGIEIRREDAEHVWLRAGAGEIWHAFVLFCVERGYGGVENLSLIPGQVGAAPMQNIGAYGVELESVCEQVEALHLGTGEAASFSRRECSFGYRDSVFKNRYKGQFLITAVTFRLHKKPKYQTAYGDLQRTLEEMGVTDLSVKAISDAVIRIRSSKLPDPSQTGNAGSFFKNPVLSLQRFRQLESAHPGVPHYPEASGDVKVPAAWLIEQCGWKGRTLGGAGVHEAHALVLVNRGGATGSEVVRLAEAIRDSVRQRFGIELVPEVNLI